MPALKVISPFLFIILFIAACGGEEEKVQQTEAEERLPKVDQSKFLKVATDRFEISVLKEMSENRVSGDVLFNANYLPHEYHLKVVKIPKSRFEQSVTFPKDASSHLKWFAEDHSQKLQDHLIEVEEGPLKKITSNKKACFTQTLHCKEFGFPKEKTYFLRYYQTEDAFIAITAWTIASNEKKFAKLVQYMGMTFRKRS